MNLTLLLDIGNIVSFIAILLQIKAVLKNRNMLRGYSIIGSFITFIALTIFTVVFYLMGMWTWIFGLATTFYWLTAFFFSAREKVRVWLGMRKGEESVYKSMGFKTRKEFRKFMKETKNAVVLVGES